MTMSIEGVRAGGPIVGVEVSDIHKTEDGVSDVDLLAEPSTMSFGDIGAEITRLIRQTAHSQKQVALRMEQSQMALEEKAHEEQIDAIQHQAIIGLVSSCVSGGVQIGSAVGTIAATVKAEAASAKYEKAKSTIDTTEAEHTKNVESAKESADSAAKLAKNVDHGVQILKASMPIVDGAFTLASAGEKAAEKDAEHRADIHERASKKAEDTVKDAQKLADDALEFYKDWLDGQHAALQASIRRA